MDAAPEVISCRNVLVYLGPDVATKVVAALAECLAVGGLLILGAVEVPARMPAVLEPFEPTVPGAFHKRPSAHRARRLAARPGAG